MQPLIVLAGPTAVGKTELSVRLAERIGGEIISADSMQVYRGMDIGSAKATEEERRGIPHYLLDILDPSEEFHVVAFQEAAREAMKKIYANGHIPILTGGTGFYIQAITRDIDFTETGGDPAFRRELEQMAAEGRGQELYERLRAVDPEAAQEIHPNNHKRVIRALEYAHYSGEKISEHNRRERERSSPYRLLYLVLSRDRQELYRRIDRRVDLMMENGLLDEVRALREKGYDRSLVSMQGLGYKELLACLDGECTLEEAVYTIKRDTRHFAKRQLTWFKRESDAVWLAWEDYPTEEAMLNEILRLMQERGIAVCEGV